MKMPCPHCTHSLSTRSSREVSLLTRELYMQCRNVECAYTCKVYLSISHTIASSCKPNPKAYLPVVSEHSTVPPLLPKQRVLAST
ncbi:MAG: ogr/Delta-like zinc finger family protein [Ottowia sp.]|nr:ogr/Delta-like zinc finger family protein [Ottowia sp.]